MNIDDNIQKDVQAFKPAGQPDEVVDRKLDELIALLKANELDSAHARILQQKFNQALERHIPFAAGFNSDNPINAFQQIGINTENSREAMLNEFDLLLSTHQLDSNASRKYILSQQLRRFTTGAIGVIMLTLGFAMIVMPAPPYFEMFTIFYFNRDDGVTLMDLIALLIVFTGIYLCIRAFMQKALKR